MTTIEPNSNGTQQSVPAPRKRWDLHLKRMRGRDSDEPHRVATTLELLYDLSFVVVLAVCGVQLAHAGASGHLLPGFIAFMLVQVTAVWGWMNYSWFASGFDTDDWGVRLSVALQMIGMIVFATGIPEFFNGMYTWQPRGTTLVMGYVVLRIAMVFLWLRVAHATPGDKFGGKKRALWTVLIQACWVLVIVGGWFRDIWFIVFPLLWILELVIPVLIERRYCQVPFHPHHLAERFGLLTIISIGEIVVGTAEATVQLHARSGWNASTIVMVAVGISLALTLWWLYFAIPFGDALAHQRSKVALFAYLHFGIFMMITAIGAGIHVAALAELGESQLGAVATVAAIAVPNAILLIVLGILTFSLVLRNQKTRLFQTELFAVTVAFLAGAVGLAAAGVPIPQCLILIVLAPIAQVVGMEIRGGAQIMRALSALGATAEGKDPEVAAS